MKQPYFEKIVSFIKEKYPGQDFIPLHAPVFAGNEKKYLLDTIDSTFVSSVGEYVKKFEEMICEITGAKFAIATVNGTNALHMALIMAGVDRDDEVISQSLTFIATCNAISYLGASPVFVDVDKDSLGMSPISLVNFLKDNTEKRKDGFTYNIHTGKRIKACVPMHTFGLPCRIDELVDICNSYNIAVVEDAAESIGSYYKNKHTGIYGLLGVFSFNGNKTITCGAGGAIVTNNQQLAEKAKHLTTQAKIPHAWAFFHDEIGYNYRMPNLNAALACGQLEQLGKFVERKRNLSKSYSLFFKGLGVDYVSEIANSHSNYWLNAIVLSDINERDAFLNFSNSHGVMTRPSWELMHRLPMFKNNFKVDLSNSEWLSDRIVNIPSSCFKM
jgi:perosamine synthetase